MSKVLLRVRCPNAQFKIDDVTQDTTLKELKQKLEQLGKIPTFKQKIKIGYPPQELKPGNDEKKLSELNIKSGETLIVEESDDYIVETSFKKPTPENYKGLKFISFNELEGYIPAVPSEVTSNTTDGYAVRRKIEADNSCMFNAVAYTLEGSQSRKKPKASGLRQVIADIVKTDKDFYSEVVLGQPNAEYCRWILKSDSWGGAIELSILSDFYKIEICAFDIKSTRMDRYGEDKNYSNRIYLLYDGIHYDALAFSPMEETLEFEDCDVTVFSTDDYNMEMRAKDVVKQINKRHEYTDTSSFKLRCLNCGNQFIGQKEAALHYDDTGHDQFAENL